MGFVLYLTGAPAVGKSTVAAALAALAGAEVLSYGALLTARLRSLVADQVELRARSAQVVSPEDVMAVDDDVRSRIEEAIQRDIDVVVDSHAITAEEYGFRAVPYSLTDLRALHYTHVVCLTLPSDRVVARLQRDPAGRRNLSAGQLDLHAQLQASLALTYAHTAGIPVAFIDADKDRDAVAADVLHFVKGSD